MDSPTTVVNVNRLPPLSSCLQVRAKLQEAAETMASGKCQELRAVAVWNNYGTFSREDVSTMISAHEVRRIRGMVKEEEKWFSELENLLLDYDLVDKIEEVRNFRDLIWSNDENDVVLNYGEKAGIRVHDLCSVVCNRWLTDDLLSFLFQSMNVETTAHYFQVMSEPLMLSQSVRQRLFDILERKLIAGNLEYIHFALNVKRCEKTGVVTVSRSGNHWTYFAFSVRLNEMYYGDSLGWATPTNLFSLFKPIFELFQSKRSKTAVSTQLTLMHTPNSLDFNGQHECCYLCYQAFPKQRCGNICGFAPLLMCCLAATCPVIWKSILREHQPSLAILRGVSKLTNLSESSLLVRVEVMSWLTRRQVTFSPAILDHNNLLSECLASTKELTAGLDNYQGAIKLSYFYYLKLVSTIEAISLACTDIPSDKLRRGSFPPVFDIIESPSQKQRYHHIEWVCMQGKRSISDLLKYAIELREHS